MKIIIALFAIFILICCTTDKIIKTTNKYTPTIDDNSRDIVLINLINEYRTSNGISPLVPETLLNKLTKEHVIWLTENVFNSEQFEEKGHYYFQNRADQTSSNIVGEIVAYNFNSAQNILNGYISSPKHHRILIDSNYNYIGSCTIGDFNSILLVKY